MPGILPWRLRASAWLGAVGVLSVLAYGVRFAAETSVSGYWPAAVAGSAVFLIFSCGVSATAAAWEGRRARSSRALLSRSVRSDLWVVGDVLWPPFVSGCVVQAAALLVMSRDTWGAPGAPPPAVLVALVSIVLFHTILGYTLGRWLPPLAGVPAALLSSYCWLGFTWSVDYFPLRYLAGLSMSDCCTIETVLDPQAPLTAIVFSLLAAIALFFVAVAHRSSPLRTKRRGAVLGATAMVLVVASALTSASPLGATALRARSASELRCEGAAPTVCLFPEQTARGAPETIIRRVAANLGAAGVRVPRTIRAGTGASTSATLQIVVQVGMTDADLVHSVTTSFLPPEIAAYCGSPSDYDRRLNAAAVADRWLIAVGSSGIVPSDDVAPATELTDDELLHRLDQAGPAAQRDWVIETLTNLTDCDSDLADGPLP
ncbi:DUF7224 domain-containing protein [Curtobacterium luteum]|uniref:DUF7224 domain-containing protein n=1 Tax=Curtobacterium luteum TaxID=33881 RepID=A0A175RGJ0_9MICO|nr:hypothetical protein [Curtobacterium luteum]KTR02393.1 hypothetical protein NS184_16170 [Curtobacterium luteum]